MNIHQIVERARDIRLRAADLEQVAGLIEDLADETRQLRGEFDIHRDAHDGLVRDAIAGRAPAEAAHFESKE